MLPEIKHKENRAENATYRGRKCLVLGAGAVGSYLIDILVKMEVSHITVLDFDRYEPGNLRKTCSVVTQEEVDEYKAEAVVKKVKPWLSENTTVNYIVGSIELLGPLAISGYDYIFSCPDNKAAREYLNQLRKMLPLEMKPFYIVGGTDGEMAKTSLYQDDSSCYRCECEENAFLHSAKRVSCNEVRYRYLDDGTAVPLSASNLSSLKAALLMADCFRRHANGTLGAGNYTETWLSDPPWEQPPIRLEPVLRRENCPDCTRIFPPEDIIYLQGSTLETTLAEAMEQIRSAIHHDDFALDVHIHKYAEEEYREFVLRDTCKRCGTVTEVYSHSSRQKTEVLCRSCKKARCHPQLAGLPEPPEKIYGFSYGACEKNLLEKSLFALGYPIGAYYHVTCMNGAVSLLDSKVRQYTFAFSGDVESAYRNFIQEDLK